MKIKKSVLLNTDYIEVYNYPINSLLKAFTLLPNKPDI